MRQNSALCGNGLSSIPNKTFLSSILSKNRPSQPLEVILSLEETLKSQQRSTKKVFVYKIQVNPIHTILKYGDCYDFMDR